MKIPFALTLITVCALNATPPTEPTDLPHPALVEPLLTWETDRDSPVRAVKILPDTAISQPHRQTITENGTSRQPPATLHTAARAEGRGKFSYRHLGTTTSGLTALMTYDDGAGREVAVSVLMLEWMRGRMGRLNLGGRRPGRYALTVEDYTGFSKNAESYCGSGVVCAATLRGDGLSLLVTNPAERTRNGAAATSHESFDFRKPGMKSATPFTPAASTPTDTIFAEADTSFTLNQTPIIPSLLAEFLTPGVVEIDLLHPGENRNWPEFIIESDNATGTWISGMEPGDLKPSGTRYHHVGRTPGGIHVVQIAPDAAGTTRILMFRVVRATRPEMAKVAGVTRRANDSPTVALRLVGEIQGPAHTPLLTSVTGGALVLKTTVTPTTTFTIPLPVSL